MENEKLSQGTVEQHLVARSIAHGSILRVLVSGAIRLDPDAKALFEKILERDLADITDPACVGIARSEAKSIIG